MLQIVLGVVIGVIATLGIVWFVRKYKAQIREILSKYLYWIFDICFPLLTGLVIGALTHSTGEELGSWADWVSGIATSLALIFAYAEIRNSREQFEKEHKPELTVYTGWKESLISEKIDGKTHSTLLGVQLHAVPVNKGMAAGIYRYLGICKKEDLNEILSLVKKVKNNTIDATEVDELARVIYYDLNDVNQNEKKYDKTGMSLIYPDDIKLFQTIKSNSVGKIIDKNTKGIVNKLNVNIFEDKLEVLYMDLNMKVYSSEVKPYNRPKSTVKIRLPSNKIN